ncbi:MAG TPA: hypothetical protein VJ952_05130, partial [Opitutales bacterium]|nr:hypothetical protein [Opitutales bacterium]
MRMINLWFCFFFAFGMFSSVAHAQALLFSQAQTGQDLYQQNGGATNFYVTPSEIGAGYIKLDPTANEQVLFSWNLLAAGIRGDLLVDVTVDYTPLSSDNDPVFLISDGSVGVGVIRLDSGTVYAQKYNDNGGSLNGRTQSSSLLTE